MANVVYWIHHPDHTDIFTQGYVGISSRFERRMKEHNWSKQNAYLKNAIEKYGWDNLVKEVILMADRAYCLMIETKLRATKQIGWNLVEGGGNPPINKSNLGKKGLPAWNKGKTLSEKTKKRVSDSVKKLWENPEYRQHMSDIHKGSSNFSGKKHSIETIEKIRLAKLGKKASEETREKMREAHKKLLKGIK
jgi:predicted GIY-YIG superfamily endonuclease